MSDPFRLIATPTGTPGEVRFELHFAAPTSEAFTEPAAATLHTGDGRSYDLGQWCAPTAVTWREQRASTLLTHRYTAAGPFTALLRWGLTELRVAVTLAPPPTPPAATLPDVALFAVTQAADDPFQRQVTVRVAGLPAPHSLRLDGGSGQARLLAGATEDVTVRLSYAKPGRYQVALDLLDGDGFWAATLSETPIEVQDAEGAPPASAELPQPAIAAEISAAEPRPWLPYRNIRPVRGVYTYQSPGGSAVSRSVNANYFLTARAETVISGKRWFQTALGDWIAADVVTFFVPSGLRGVVLDTAAPPPPPPDSRQGIVTANVLNVRAAPGVSAGNPPIATLRAGAQVTIYEERSVAGATWYRIGENRWVHSGYVQIVSDPPPPPVETRRGVVTATVLNVRAAPGVSAHNPPIATLRAGAEVTIYEERAVGSEPWYRIGEGRWVAGAWVRVVAARVAALAEVAEPAPPQLPFGWVVTEALNVRGRPGVDASNPPIGQLGHYARVALLEERSVSGVRWFRIGEGQWIEGRQVGVARRKPRPASIAAGERWAGVSLAEQTLVAYEGDRPVFAALIASGLPGTPTVQGIFRTWLRLTTGKMSGPGYYIEDVTWTCYFYGGYALHTAYWHDAFGAQRSHGCVNLSPHDAWWVYQWSAAGGANSPAVYVYWA